MSQANPIATDRPSTLALGKLGILRSPGRTLLGLIFLWAAYAKFHFNGTWHFQDYHFFLAMAIGSYRTLPSGLVQWVALILPWLELALGTLLIAGVATRWTGLVSSALLAFMACLPRSAMLGLANRSKPASELLIDFGLSVAALTVALRAFRSQRARQDAN